MDWFGVPEVVSSWFGMPDVVIDTTYWELDELHSVCPICLTPEFGFMNGKHHCRSCGTVCCESCSMRRAPVPPRNIMEYVRVCDPCIAKSERENSVNQTSSNAARGNAAQAATAGTNTRREQPQRGDGDHNTSSDEDNAGFGVYSGRMRNSDRAAECPVEFGRA